MKYFELVITAKEPLVITDGSAESMAHKSLSYIPGNMLLGAFASLWIRKNPGVVPDDSHTFRALFLGGGVEWGHAYPSVENRQCVPIPLTYHKVKNYEGLPVVGTTSFNGLVCNTMRLKGDDALSTLCHENTPSIPADQIKLKKMSLGFMDAETYSRPLLHFVWNMHVALSATRRAAQDGQLFGYEALAPGTTFRSIISCHNDAVSDTLRDLLGLQESLRVGHARSAGYGHVEFSFGERLHEAPPTPVPDGEGIVVTYLLSDYMPRKQWETPLEGLKNDLSELWGQPIQIHLSRSSCRQVLITGFSGVWRLPRSTRAALEKGSVLVCRVQGPLPETAPVSLGGCCHEGYGQMLFNPSFLEEAKVAVRPLLTAKTACSTELPSHSGKLLGLMRHNTLRRLVQTRSETWLAKDDTWRFIKSVAGKAKPTQSQRGNIRRLLVERHPEEWNLAFSKMLEKRPGKQWASAVGQCPFTHRKEHLSDIMKQFFDPKFAQDNIGENNLALPGGPPSRDELHKAREAFHRSALLLLLQAWGRHHRTSGLHEEN